MLGDSSILTFHFEVLPLFQLDAEQFVRNHVVCMYPLLPTMQGVQHEMVKQVMQELAALYQADAVTLKAITYVRSTLGRKPTHTAGESQK
jgi:hypothetical protein